MRKDTTIEKIMLGGEKVNKSALTRQYGCCWETIDRRLNPDKYKKEKKIRTYNSILDTYKNIIDEKLVRVMTSYKGYLIVANTNCFYYNLVKKEERLT